MGPSLSSISNQLPSYNQSTQTFLNRQLTFSNEKSYTAELDRLNHELKCPLNNPNILSLLKIDCREVAGFCSSTYKIKTYYENPCITLSDEISTRAYTHNYFHQEQLCTILQACIGAMSHLKSEYIFSTSTVHIVTNGNIKLLHNDLINADYRHILNKTIYYAPEKLGNFNTQDDKSTLKKQSIFSLGMIMLECAQLSLMNQCYNWETFQICSDKIANIFEELYTRYSVDIVEVFEFMLEINPNRRVSMMEIQGALNRFWNNYNGKQQLKQQNSGDISLHNEIDQNQMNFSQYNNQNKSENDKKQGKIISKANNTQLSSSQCQQPLQDNNYHDQLYAGQQQHSNAHHIYSSNNIQKSQHINTNINKSNLTQKSHLTEIQNQTQRLHQKSSLQNIYSNRFVDQSLIPYQSSQKNSINKIESSMKQNNTLYTDPKLLQIIKKDLQTLNKIKHDINKNTETKPIEFVTKNYDMSKKASYAEGNIIIKDQKDNDNCIYSGMLLNGKRHGKGRLNYGDGTYYQGQFQNGLIQGYGVLYYSQNQPAYQGMWCNDKFHGHGVLHNEIPFYFQQNYNYNDFNQVEDYWSKYEGNFIEDNKSGKGCLQLANGQLIIGNYQNDCLNGQGIFFTRSGQQIKGRWQNNILVQILQS